MRTSIPRRGLAVLPGPVGPRQKQYEGRLGRGRPYRRAGRALVSQESVFFHGIVADNVRLGRPDAIGPG